jgi:DNA-binding IclR family transcriptional regulator
MDELDTIDAAEIRRVVQRALDARPEDGFTAVSLARRLDLPVTAVRRALVELASLGLAVADDDEFASALQLD